MGNTTRTHVSIPTRLHQKAKALDINVSRVLVKALKLEIEDRQLLDKIHAGELKVEPTT